MKKVFIVLIAVSALAACSKEPGGTADGRVEIKLASKTLTVSTKTPFDGTIGTRNPLLAFVPVTADAEGDYTTPLDGSHGYMNFTDSGTSAVGFVSKDGSTPAPKYYPADGSEVYLCGLFPHDAWTEPTTTASATIDGKSDLMSTLQIATTKVDVQQGGTPETLEFKHLLTRLNIEMTADDAVALESWGDVTGLTLVKVGKDIPANSAAVTLSVGEASFSGEAPTQCYTLSDATITADAPVSLSSDKQNPAKAYVLCEPVDAENNDTDYTLSVTTTKNTTPYEIPLELVFDADFTEDKSDTAGQSFTVTLTFKATQIMAKAIVTPWEDAGTSTGVVQ